MLFPTVTFAVFFVAVYALHVALQSRDRAWKVTMVVASYVFYGWWDWRFCGLLAGSTVMNWTFGRAVRSGGPRAARLVVGGAVTTNLAILSAFKYYGFFAEAADRILGAGLRPPAVDLLLPVGISFFTFQALSYVIDCHRRQVSNRSLLDFAVYLSFFPHLVAGPIVRASEFLPQLDGRRQVPIDVIDAGWHIARGLFKKMVIATYLAEAVVDPVFAAPSLASRGELLAALYGYAIQIYADFSGYTDIAIGIAALFGIRFPVNFDRPYGARSMQDFWRRWHMTLSRWLRDYLYVPLGGSRGSAVATYRNLMVTMVLGGLWHGAAWTFVLWGAIHGGALAAERLAADRWRLPGPAWAGTALRWLVTFHVVCLAWVLFRAESMSVAGQFLVGLATAPLSGPVNLVALAVVAGALLIQLSPGPILRRLYIRLVHQPATRLDPVAQSALLGVWLSLVIALGPRGVAPFIYFRF